MKSENLVTDRWSFYKKNKTWLHLHYDSTRRELLHRQHKKSAHKTESVEKPGLRTADRNLQKLTVFFRTTGCFSVSGNLSKSYFGHASRCSFKMQ